MIKFLKELLCRHEWTTTIGTGIYDKKKNHAPLIIYPVMKLKCKKCKFEDYISKKVR